MEIDTPRGVVRSAQLITIRERRDNADPRSYMSTWTRTCARVTSRERVRALTRVDDDKPRSGGTTTGSATVRRISREIPYQAIPLGVDRPTSDRAIKISNRDAREWPSMLMQLDCARNCRHGDSIIASLPHRLMDDGEDSACKLVTGWNYRRSRTGGVHSPEEMRSRSGYNSWKINRLFPPAVGRMSRA